MADVTMNREKLTAKNRGKKLNPTENFVVSIDVFCGEKSNLWASKSTICDQILSNALFFIIT